MNYSQRRFGVEIEHGGSRDVAMKANKLAFGKEATGVGNDGSGIELRTPPLKGKKGFEQLRTCMDYLKKNGQWVSRSDGMHVHIEALDYIGQPKLLGKLVRSWMNIDPILRTLVSPYRYERLTDPWDKKQHAEKLEKGKSVGNVYRWNLNLASILNMTFPGSIVADARPTVEVRLHEGSIDSNVAIPWIVLMQAIFDTIVEENRTIRPHKNVETLTNRLNIVGEPQALLIARSMIDPEEKRLLSREVMRNHPTTQARPELAVEGEALQQMPSSTPGYSTDTYNHCNCESCCAGRAVLGSSYSSYSYSY